MNWPNLAVRPGAVREKSAPGRPEPSGRLPLRVIEEAQRDADQVLLALRSSPEGLSHVEVLIRRASVGANEISHERPPAWYVQLLQAFKNPFILLLLVLAVVSLGTQEYEAAVVIAVMVTTSVLMRFVQEYRSGKAAARLQAMVHTTASVSRPAPRTEVPPGTAEAFGIHLSETARLIEVPIQSLVPGDVIHLSAGDMVPADVRILSAKDLFTSQSALTGESLPVEKRDLPGAPGQALPPDFRRQRSRPGQHVCFMGTNVVSGSAQAVVVATGEKTYFGSLARHLVGKRAATEFDKGVNGISWLLIRFMLVMVPLVFVITGVTKGEWWEAFFFGLSVAVGLTPEMLPMIVTATLARGAVRLSHCKVIVKRQSAMQNFGAMDVLCTDKTGTLTQDRVVLLRHLDVNGDDDDEVLEYAYLNSYFQTGLRNLLDRAVLEHEDLVKTKELTQRYIKCDEVPFDFHRRRMSVIVHEVFKGRDLLLCKGAVEEVVSVCDFARIDGQVEPLSDALRERAKRLRDDLNHSGLRLIAVASKAVESRPGKEYGVADESGLVLCGYVAFLDPPKETAAPAVEALRQHGVAVKILTGDNDLVARKVCREVGLGSAVTLLGNQIELMSDLELEEAAEKSVLFAKLTPPQKARTRSRAAPRSALGITVGVPRRRHQRRPGPARGRRGYLGRYRRRHRPRVGRHHPAGKEPDGPGARRASRTNHLRQHHQIHQDGGQLELRQHVQRAGGEHLLAVPAHAAAADAGAEDLLYDLSANSHSLRPGRSRIPRKAAQVGCGRRRPIHAVCWPGQLGVPRSSPSLCCGSCSGRGRGLRKHKSCSTPAGSSRGCCRRH